ncbi:MAG: uroporphyrinogen-III C-methyltransferase, partial [Candidatus Caldatribacteriaceae bacterium]
MSISGVSLVGKKVYIVGAGPGDPGLLTRRAWELVQRAEVIVYDRLVGEGIVALFPEGAECIYVGKEPGNHPVPQEEIHEILRARAEEGKMVVRLKGGDPFIFGRGGEEALFLVREGFEVEVVPGVSSALAVPALAGIPLTHRGVSSSFLVVSGNDFSILPWETMASFSGTLVVLMGARNLSSIVEKLLAMGVRKDLPVALVMEGSTARQRTLVGTLSNIAVKAQEAGFANPLIFVAGEVVNLHQTLTFLEHRPLFGRRLLFTGTTMESFSFPVLAELGVEVLHYPTVRIELCPEALEEAWKALPGCQILLLSSKNAVAAFREMARRFRLDLRHLAGLKIAVVGKKTAQELASMGLFPDYCPSSFTVRHLLALFPKGKGERVLLLTSQIGGEEALQGFTEKGYVVQKVSVYRNVPNLGVREGIRSALENGVDAVVFTSPSSFHSLEACLGGNLEMLARTLLVSIGPTTARFIAQRGLQSVSFPEEHT